MSTAEDILVPTNHPALQKTDNTEWFLLKTYKCPICDKRMMKKAKTSMFPIYVDKTQESQMKARGINFVSDSYQDDDPICHECEAAGKSTFKCHCCKVTQTTDKKHESFGCYNVDYLCKNCYATVPAQKWHQLCKELDETHKYDHE